LGSSFGRIVTGNNAFGIFGATNVDTGQVVWSINVPQPATSGLVVAGDVLFFGETDGEFHGVNAATGATLFTFNGPNTVTNAGGAAAGPIAYVVNGKEYIANAFGGNALDRTANPPSPVGDAIIAFTLP
jgi:outer membrane protein assembly factor BamB